ncbi:MAG: AtpZ/AtpI family protein [Nitrospirota bacterium]
MDNPEQQPSPKKEAKSEFFRLLGVASTVGINLVISTFIGFAIGYFLLDRFLNTFPWFTIIFLILGIAAGFKYLFKIVSKMGNDKGSDNGDSEKGNL